MLLKSDASAISRKVWLPTWPHKWLYFFFGRGILNACFHKFLTFFVPNFALRGSDISQPIVMPWQTYLTSIVFLTTTVFFRFLPALSVIWSSSITVTTGLPSASVAKQTFRFAANHTQLSSACTQAVLTSCSRSQLNEISAPTSMLSCR